MTEFRCPACGFRVFNRRYPRCEGCGAELPAELLLSDEDIASRAIAQAERNRIDLAIPPRRDGWKGVVDDLVKPIKAFRERFRTWWRRTPTTRDRVAGAFCAAAAGIAALGRIAYGPCTLSELGFWVVVGIIVGVCVGQRFPKLCVLIFFPFATIG